MPSVKGYIVGERGIEIDGWVRAGKKSPRAEPGEIVTDFPETEIKGLLRDGLIRETGTGASIKAEPKGRT